MTLTYVHDLDILKFCVAEMKFQDQGFQKLEHKEDRHRWTDAADATITTAVFVGGNNC